MAKVLEEVRVVGGKEVNAVGHLEPPERAPASPGHQVHCYVDATVQLQIEALQLGLYHLQKISQSAKY